MKMRHEITAVRENSVAERAGIKPGDQLLLLNGEEIIDEIDYQALIAGSHTVLTILRDEKQQEIRIKKAEGEPLGLHFGTSMELSPRTCHNHCEFCFIAQMPKGLRDTLYVKDDDWRFSLMMGNFVTLTNVDEAEMQRIIRRKASPLYISIHSTNPALRCEMMGNRFAGNILEKLQRLKNAGIRFHCQIVVCPGRNDKEELTGTLRDLITLHPNALSVALVPVGLTRFREGLRKLQPFTADSAEELLRQIEPLQQECREKFGTTFIYPSDEFYCLCGKELPCEEWYEDFPQIENGVGLIRRFASELEETDTFEKKFGPDIPVITPRHYLIATGISAAPYIQRLSEKYAPDGVTVRVLPVVNHFFGETVTVAGLLTGSDLLNALQADGLYGIDEILLSASMLRHERDRFLDDMTAEKFASCLPVPVRFVECDGESFYAALRGH